MINVGSVVLSNSFKQPLTRITVQGVFANEGAYTQSEEVEEQIEGVAIPASQGAMDEFGVEGERLSDFAVLYVHESQPLNWSDGEGQNSDLIIYKGTKYRLYGGRDFTEYGYKKALMKKVALNV